MSFYVPVITTFATLTLVAVALSFALGTALLLPEGRTSVRRSLGGNERHPLAWAWIVAVLATGGSLYLSEVAGLLPCLLCWYQRIAMYPLVLVLGVAVLRGDAGAWRYALPLPVVGLCISLYHIALQLQPSLDVGTCDTGAPCSVRYLAVFGFVSIPWMAGGAFLLVTMLMLAVREASKEQDGAEEEEKGGGA